MESLTEKKLDETEVFNRWLADVREDKGSRYTYEDRKEHIQTLMGYLTKYEIAQDDAQFLKKRVVEALVHEEGRKGKGKYSGWKENVEADFDDAIQRTYIPGLSVDIKPVRGAQEYDPRIVSWCKTRFGDHVGPDVVKAAHQPLHTFWIMCMEDSFPDFFPKRSS